MITVTEETWATMGKELRIAREKEGIAAKERGEAMAECFRLLEQLQNEREHRNKSMIDAHEREKKLQEKVAELEQSRRAIAADRDEYMRFSDLVAAHRDAARDERDTVTKQRDEAMAMLGDVTRERDDARNELAKLRQQYAELLARQVVSAAVADAAKNCTGKPEPESGCKDEPTAPVNPDSREWHNHRCAPLVATLYFRGRPIQTVHSAWFKLT